MRAVDSKVAEMPRSTADGGGKAVLIYSETPFDLGQKEDSLLGAPFCGSRDGAYGSSGLNEELGIGLSEAPSLCSSWASV